MSKEQKEVKTTTDFNATASPKVDAVNSETVVNEEDQTIDVAQTNDGDSHQLVESLRNGIRGPVYVEELSHVAPSMSINHGLYIITGGSGVGKSKLMFNLAQRLRELNVSTTYSSVGEPVASAGAYNLDNIFNLHFYHGVAQTLTSIPVPIETRLPSDVVLLDSLSMVAYTYGKDGILPGGISALLIRCLLELNSLAINSRTAVIAVINPLQDSQLDTLYHLINGVTSGVYDLSNQRGSSRKPNGNYYIRAEVDNINSFLKNIFNFEIGLNTSNVKQPIAHLSLDNTFDNLRVRDFSELISLLG